MIKYNTIVFDCDGVILNSNAIKTEAFRNILSNYDLKAVDEFIDYHKKMEEFQDMQNWNTF